MCCLSNVVIELVLIAYFGDVNSVILLFLKFILFVVVYLRLVYEMKRNGLT